MEITTPRPGIILMTLSVPTMVLVIAGMMVTTSPALALLLASLAALMSMMTSENVIIMLAKPNGLRIQDNNYVWATPLTGNPTQQQWSPPPEEPWAPPPAGPWSATPAGPWSVPPAEISSTSSPQTSTEVDNKEAAEAAGREDEKTLLKEAIMKDLKGPSGIL